ncbi:MAG: LptE family protein [Desulfobacterales bacterium]|jgi:outer membrane lipopolysaccharide assembly protein LptE/RlpB
MMKSTSVGLLFVKKRYAWAIILFWLLFSACGYQFAGGGSLPSGITSISIEMFKNRTSETGVETIITNDLIYEFIRHEQVVVTGSDKADAILTGVVKSISERTISHKGEYTSDERRVTLKLDLQLKDKSGGVIWSAKDVSDNEAYKVSSEKQATEQLKKVAIKRLSKRLAENIFNRLTADF